MKQPIVTLTDALTGSTARISPGYGFNCYSLELIVDGQPHELLWAEEGFESGQRRASGSGIPILFPFPGRIQGTSFRYEGKSYPLHCQQHAGNAIHGFLLDRPWRVTEQSERHVVAEFQASLDDATLLEQWPADFKVTASYTLHNGRLMFSVLVENPDTRPLPFGMGLHPYFRVPIGGGSADDCVVTAPADGYWELADMIATGEIKPSSQRGRIAGGMKFAEMQFDDVFTKLQYTDGEFTASIRDPDSQRVMKLLFDDPFRECVIYNPPHREAVCLEPYTCVPDAYRLHQQGVDSGHRELAAGMTFAAKMEIWLE